MTEERTTGSIPEAVHSLHAVPINPTYEGCPICRDYLELIKTVQAAAWEEGAEAAYDWAARPTPPSGIWPDPPRNPYVR